MLVGPLLQDMSGITPMHTVKPPACPLASLSNQSRQLVQLQSLACLILSLSALANVRICKEGLSSEYPMPACDCLLAMELPS